MRTITLLLLIFSISCTSKLEKYGYACTIDPKALIVEKTGSMKVLHLKIYNDPYLISNKCKLAIRFDSKVIFNGDYDTGKTILITIPSQFFDKTIQPDVIIFKEDSEKAFHFEGKTQFYLHKNDNFLCLFFSEHKDYSERLFVSSQEIIGM